jgi:hypothetical protein
VAIDIATTQTRRSLLAAAIGAAAATVAGAMGRPSAASAANGDPVLVGQSHTETSTTSFVDSTTNGVVLAANSTSGVGLYGSSIECGECGGTSPQRVGVLALSVHDSTSVGVHAESSGIAVGGYGGPAGLAAVFGQSPFGSTGIYGFSNDGSAAPSAPPKVGVYGRCDIDSSARGVYGNSSNGVGVYGYTSTGKGVTGFAAGPGTGGAFTAAGATGVALSGAASVSTGFALKTSGRVSLAKVSGVSTIPTSATSVTVAPGVDVTSTSFALLTPKADPGTRRLWFTTDATANSLTIHVSAAVSAPLVVSWLLLG